VEISNLEAANPKLSMQKEWCYLVVH